MNKIKELKPVLHLKKDNYIYRYVLVDRFKHTSKAHCGFDDKWEMTEKEIWKSLTPRKLRRNYIITNDKS